MALKHLQSLVVRVSASAVDNGTGLEGKLRALRQAPVSYPRQHSPSYPMPKTGVRPSPSGAEDCGTALAVARAGRPGCWADVTCPTLARNPRGTIQSRWSRPLATTVTLRPGFTQARIPMRLFGAASVQG